MIPFGLLLPALLLASPQGDVKQDLHDSLIAAEYAFADMADKVNTRDAFLANLHEKSIMFGPAPVNGRTLYEKRPINSTKLSWYPAFSGLAASGELGWTTGPWQYRKAADEPVIAQGWFITLWRREGKGPWKVMLDCGISHDVPKEQTTGLPRAKASTLNLPEAPPALNTVLLPTWDDDLGALVAKQGLVKAYGTILLPQARVYREDHFPAASPRNVEDLIAATMLKTGPCTHTWKPMGSFPSRSQDLAGTYGIHTRNTQTILPPQAAYFHLWQKSQGKETAWKLLIDVENEIPAEKK